MRVLSLADLYCERLPLDAVRFSGIYFLFDQEELVYIGQALDVFVRVAIHTKDRSKTFDSFSYVPTEPKDLNRMEAYYIRTFWPTRYNRNACQPRRAREWYTTGVRAKIKKRREQWLVSATYYDLHNGPTTDELVCESLETALQDGRPFARNIATAQWRMRGGV